MYLSAFIRETCHADRRDLVEQSCLLAEGIMPRSLRWNKGPGFALGFMPVIICLGFYSCGSKEETRHENHRAGHQHIVNNDKGVMNASPGKMVISSQRTVSPVVEPVQSSLKFNGYIVPDERRTNKIAVRVGGRIETLYVKYPYQHVNKGQKILELYSPELNTYVEEYLYTLAEKNNSLSGKAKEKLMLLGMSEQQIAEIEKSGTAPFVISIYASQSGYIFPYEASAANKMNMSESSVGNNTGMDGMGINSGNSISKKYSTSAAWIREGMYVNKDQILFVINDLNEVWGMVMGNETEAVTANINDTVLVKSEQIPEKIIVSRINFIEPIYNKGQKFIRMRLYIDNASHTLQINSLFSAEIKTVQKKGILLLPLSAVLDLGQRKIAWVKTGNTKEGNGIFRLTEIKTGGIIGKNIEILSGLNKNDEIAKQAGYMLDSETLTK